MASHPLKMTLGALDLVTPVCSVALSPQPSRSSRSRDSSLSASDRNYSASPLSETRRSSSAGKESKSARKRRKRREMANKAAEEELAEISLEQQVRGREGRGRKEVGVRQGRE